MRLVIWYVTHATVVNMLILGVAAVVLAKSESSRRQ